jgi:hypothetical protein
MAASSSATVSGPQWVRNEISAAWPAALLPINSAVAIASNDIPLDACMSFSHLLAGHPPTARGDSVMTL